MLHFICMYNKIRIVVVQYANIAVYNLLMYLATIYLNILMF